MWHKWLDTDQFTLNLVLARAALIVEILCLRTLSRNVERTDATAVIRGVWHTWLDTDRGALNLVLAQAALIVEILCLRTLSGNIERTEAYAVRGMQHVWLETGLGTSDLCRFAGAVFGVKECRWGALSVIDVRASDNRLGLAFAALIVEKLILLTLSGNVG